MLNSLFFWVLIFWVKTFFSLFSLYKYSLWNLNLDSWSAWKSNQNGILVCEIWWKFEDLGFERMVVFFMVVFTWKSLWFVVGVGVGVGEVDFSPYQWDPVLSYMQLTIAPPFSYLHPPFSFSFSCIFLYYFSRFYFIFCNFFHLSISRNMQHYLIHFFLFFILLYLVYFSVYFMHFFFLFYLLALI